MILSWILKLYNDVVGKTIILNMKKVMLNAVWCNVYVNYIYYRCMRVIGENFMFG